MIARTAEIVAIFIAIQLFLRNGYAKNVECGGGLRPSRAELEDMVKVKTPADVKLPQDPFKALFLLHDRTSEENRKVLLPAFAGANRRLAKMIKGPTLNEIRFTRQDCFPVHCFGVQIPDEFTMPCNRSKATDRVRKWNQEKYTVVAYVAINGHTSYAYCGGAADAGPCNFDIQTGRSIRGRIYICSQPAEWSNEDGGAFLENLIIHELMHIVAQTFDGTSYPYSECKEPVFKKTKCEGATWKRMALPNSEDTRFPTPQTVFLSMLPSVRKEAIRYFQCKDAEGVEIHAVFDRSKQKWTPDPFHWSRRIFPEEVMTAAGSESKVSSFTLAALKDSGWYIVDVDAAEHMTISKPFRPGCDLIKKSCTEVIKKAKSSDDEMNHMISPFCIQDKGPRCSADGKILTICKSVTPLGCPVLAESPYYGFTRPSCEKSAKADNVHSIAGARVGDGTMCVTFTKFDMLQTEKEPIPTCVSYKCYPGQISFNLHPAFPAKNLACKFTCTNGSSNRRIDHRFHGECGKALGKSISYLCPEFTKVCSAKRTTDRIDCISAVTVGVVIRIALMITS